MRKHLVVKYLSRKLTRFLLLLVGNADTLQNIDQMTQANKRMLHVLQKCRVQLRKKLSVKKVLNLQLFTLQMITSKLLLIDRPLK